MIQKLKSKLLILSSLLFLALPLAVPAMASAQDPNPTVGVCYGAEHLQINPNPDGSCPAGAGTTKVNSLITEIINVFSVVVGIVAVIMIIVGGFRYVTSGGSSEKVTAAKNTLLYAIIGLVIVALSQIIVKFVLDKTVNG
jgi:cytochrome bd-type quinol oxidase subunit 2